MGRRITALAASELPCPPGSALPTIWDIQGIERTEVKADRVRVHPTGSRTGSYDVRGRFAGVPWTGRFEYELDDRGFHSRTADVPREDATVEGGFVLTPLGENHSTVIHYEQYVLAPWLAPIASLVRWYLQWSMRRELRVLRALVVDNQEIGRSGEPSADLVEERSRPSVGEERPDGGPDLLG